MGRFALEKRPAWAWWVTPKPLKAKPIHRWYVFPHSFTGELVQALIQEWGLGPKDSILDPFCGAGTTVLGAKEKGIPATGYDLSPLAVLVSQVKTANYKSERLKEIWETLHRRLLRAQWLKAKNDYPRLVLKALPGRLLGAFETIQKAINNLNCSTTEQNFFRLALLSILPQFSHAIATGGWLSWVRNGKRLTSIPPALFRQVQMMLEDASQPSLRRGRLWDLQLADARRLPDKGSRYSAVITSPPYPNRHDYTRVFGVELMFSFLSWKQTRELRYQSFHSHPEAHPRRPNANGYVPPSALSRAIRRMRKGGADPKVTSLLEGYFLDMYLCLREIKRVCRPSAKIALVVGNAQYSGESVPVDELTADIGEQAGLVCDKLLIARYRGNSAQQMGRYGRNPSRESVVVFHRNGD